MGESSKARELYDALRALEDKARAGYGREFGHAYSRRALAEAADGRESKLDRRLAVWMHADWTEAKTPKLSSSEKLIAVVRHLSAWAGERFDEGWWRTLLDQAQPRRSPLPSARARERGDESYAAWIEEHILSAQLVDREAELEELAEFCSGPDLPGVSAYRWWQAPPWAGKSALVADFALRHRPDTVEVVSCFITDRLGRNDQSVFLETVMRQLALIAQREVGAAESRPEDLPGLCRAAAEACQNRGRRLVLIVDGLDEDQGAASGRPSIAALLPRVPPAGMRVVVTSRPSPPVPDDVPPDHTLRAVDIIRTLDPWSHATGISVLARHELRRLLDDEEVGLPLLGLLVAARGGLTSADLARLVGVRPYRVDRLLRGVTGRSFVPGSHGQVVLSESHATPHVHALGHEELRQEALIALGDVSEFERQLHEWADGYCDRKWPSGTPSYLLYDYPHMLHSAGDLQRLSTIALDPHRQRALMERASLDTAFTHIELTAQLVRRQCPEDLVELTALAASSAVLAERARALPAGVPLTFARLGHARRAMDLALVAPFPSEKAVRLAKVARVLVGVGDRLAAEAASEAARWAEQALRESAPTSGDEQEAEEAIGEAAVALIAVGELRRGRELLGWLRASADAGDKAGATVVARAAFTARSHDPALTEELLAQAERYADELAAASPADPSAPVAAWAAIAATAEGPRADRMYERIRRYAQAFPPQLTACAVDASAASALATVRPEDAITLAGRAATRLEAALGDPEGLSTEDGRDLTILLSYMLTTAVRALVDTGSVDRARGLVACVPEKRHIGLMGMDTRAGARALLADKVGDPDQEPSAQTLAEQAYRLADRDERDASRRRLSQALEALGSSHGQVPRRLLPSETWLISLCAALSAIGRHPDGAQLARSLRDPVEQVQALAAAAVAASLAGHLQDGRRLASEAADRTRTLEGADDFSFFSGAPGHKVRDAKGAAAQALAHVGDRDRALALAEETGKADHDARHRSLVAIAAGLRFYDPATTVDLIDRQRERLLTADSSRGWSGRIAELSELFAALVDADEGCADRLHQAAEHVAQQLKASETWLNWEDRLTMLLLYAREEPDDARSTLVSWEPERVGTPPWEEPTAALAIAHAALGNLALARRHASRHNVPYDRAEAFAAVAGYLAGTPAGLRAVSASTSTAFTETFRPFALTQIPPDPVGSAQEARQFTASALAGDGWHCTLRVLAHIEPAAVERVRDIVFAHRRLPLQTG